MYKFTKNVSWRFLLNYWLALTKSIRNKYLKKIFPTVCSCRICTQRTRCRILFNLLKFRLWYHFSDRFSTIRDSVWCQINRGKWVITIQIWFDLTRFKSFFSVCMYMRKIIQTPYLFTIEDVGSIPHPFPNLKSVETPGSELETKPQRIYG